MPFINVYPASKTCHAQKWRKLDLESPFIKVTARWVKQIIIDNGDLLKNNRSSAMARRCWIEDQEDIARSDCLMLYAELTEHLRGGLVEAGMAIQGGVPVVIIGEHDDYGSWQHHPGVVKIKSLYDFESYCEGLLKTKMAKA